MASYHDLLDAIARIRSVTGDPEAWTKGLTGDDVATVCNPASPPQQLGAVLAKVTAAHPEVFLAGSPAGPPSPPPRTGEGAAAEAIREAEAALARQNTDAAHVDLQVVTAVLNAHAAHDDGLAELIALQRNIEDAVVSRTDLDTPAGAREFQRFLIGKLRDIRNVVENSSLDATSKASLAAALAMLYSSTTPDPQERSAAEERKSDSDPAPTDPGYHRHPTAETASSTTVPVPAPWELGQDGALWPDAVEPLQSEPPWFDVPPPTAPAVAAPSPAAVPPAAVAPAPVLPPPAPAAPAWAGGLPGGAPFGGGLPALGSPASSPALAELPRAELSDRLKDGPRSAAVEPGTTNDQAEVASEDSDDRPEDPSPADEGATTVNLPDGETVTAPSPEVAAAITAAVAGTPIPDAFRLQGIAIPAPGSVVTAPLDPARLAPGDIGVFADRHALALGNGKVLLDQQIQPTASVSGPEFLGWQHPPEPQLTNATPDAPAPTRAAETVPS